MLTINTVMCPLLPGKTNKQVLLIFKIKFLFNLILKITFAKFEPIRDIIIVGQYIHLTNP